jgi:CBS domain containing-hemolysin-like protein
VVAIALAFGLVTVFHIVLGELAPKSLALQRSERTALVTSKPLELFLTVFRPAILLLNRLGNGTVRLFGLEPEGEEGSAHSVEELQLLVAASRSAGLVSEEAEDIVERAFRLDDLAARQVMVPRVDIVAVSIEKAPEEALSIAVQSHHTHLPVYRESIDDIVGVVSVLDLLEMRRHERLDDMIRSALLVPETMAADVLLSEMRALGQQLAILVDEFGGTGGLVTIHDLVDELVGPIPAPNGEGAGEVLPDGSISLNGLAPIHQVNDQFGLHLPSGEFDTVGGFILARLGRMAHPGDQIDEDGYRLQVEALHGRRIARVRVEPM